MGRAKRGLGEIISSFPRVVWNNRPGPGGSKRKRRRPKKRMGNTITPGKKGEKKRRAKKKLLLTVTQSRFRPTAKNKSHHTQKKSTKPVQGPRRESGKKKKQKKTFGYKSNSDPIGVKKTKKGKLVSHIEDLPMIEKRGEGGRGTGHQKALTIRAGSGDLAPLKRF